MAGTVRPPDEGTPMTRHAAAAERLIELGFSPYEARAYVGLLGREPQTGYGLANITGIPQPKVYETLRRLSAKGVVATVGDDPARFVAVPADQLLAGIEDSFRARLSSAESELAAAAAPDGAVAGYRVLRSLNSWPGIEEYAVGLVKNSNRHVYVSINCPEPGAVASALGEADGRGVACDVLHFGEPIV